LYCSNCGKKLNENAKFCDNCGKSVIQKETEIRDEGIVHKDQRIVSSQSASEVESSNTEEVNNIEANYETVKSEENQEVIEISNTQAPVDGSQVNVSTNESKSNKKSKKKFIALIVAVLAIAIFGIFFYINVAAQTTSAMLNETDSILPAFGDYIIDDYKSEYNSLLTSVSEQKVQKDKEEIKKLLVELKGLQAKLQQNNMNIIDKTLKETKAIDTSRAYEDELKKMKDYETKVAGFKKENKFISARDELTQWNKLLEEIDVNYNNYDISVNQMDFSSFPKIRAYITIEDKVTKEVPKNLDPRFFYISEKNAKNSQYIKQSILKATQLDQQENLNINMVADISGSMFGKPLDTAKNIMINFLDKVQFNIKDKVELTAFASGVQTYATFSDNKELLKSQILGFKTGDMTALYDALFAAVNTTAVQKGAKCVVAFTDGKDNFSKTTPNEVIETAKRYNIPIFIIGIGESLDNTLLQSIANSTNGYYRRTNNISDISDIYQKIYRKNKEMYIVEYETQDNQNISDLRDIKVDVQTRKEGGAVNYSFTPRLLMSTEATINHTDKINELIGNYLTNYIFAINNHNYSYIEKYIIPGGGVEKEVKPYIMNNIQEKLLSYEVVKKENKDDSTCIVTTRETYEVQNHEQPLHMRVLEGYYEIKKQPDGSWKILNFADLYKVLSQINY